MALVEGFKRGDIVVVKGINSPRMKVTRIVDLPESDGETAQRVYVLWFNKEGTMEVDTAVGNDLLELAKEPVTHPMLD
jgi:hypothetical protein